MSKRRNRTGFNRDVSGYVNRRAVARELDILEDALPTRAPRTSPEEQARLAEEAKTFPVTKLPYFGPSRENDWQRDVTAESLKVEENAKQVARTNATKAAKVKPVKLPLLQRIRSIDVSEVVAPTVGQ